MAQKLITKAIEKAINKTPYRSQDGKGADAKVIARIFGGRLTAYILEGYQLDGEAWDGNTVYGLVEIDGGFEYGPFNLKDFENGYKFGPYRLPFERDIYVDPLKDTIGYLAHLNGETARMPFGKKEVA